MKDLAIQQQQKISSIELLDVINSARAESGESEIRRNDFMARIADELEGDHYETFVVQNSNKTESVIANLTHDQSLLVGMRESKGVRRKVLDKLKTLEQPKTAQPAALQDSLLLIEAAARMLNACESSKLMMLGNAAKRHGIDPVGLLPSYAIDAPSDLITAGSSRPTKSLTALLKDHGVKMSAARANLALCTAGVLENQMRKGTSGKQKAFWSLTDQGLYFGKNITNPASPRETQPHYYVDRFDELLVEIGL